MSSSFDCNESVLVNRRPYPRDATVPEVFASQVQRAPDAVALVTGDQTITYRDLADRAARAAWGLRQRGVGAGDRVGVVAARTPAMIISFLAVLQCGAVYVPLDDSYPDTRLSFLIADAKLALIVAPTASRTRLATLGVTAFATVDDLAAPAPTDRPEDACRPGPTPLAPAYLMYTSGSTGGPKGTIIPHRAIVRLVCGTDYLPLTSDDVCLQVSSPSFDASTLEIWAPLLNGARLVLPPAGLLPAHTFVDLIARHGVTTLFLTTGLFHALVGETPALFRPLRHLLIGGEVASPVHARACRQACPETRLLNCYGPTENTTFSTWYEVPADTDGRHPLPIGRPIANSEVWILDATLAPVAPGSAGELCLGGDGLALGYWQRPDLDAAKFIRHPRAEDPTARLYRSGDLARLNARGEIEFLGRRDRQVKVRGHRIELAEIETAIAGLPGVRQCAVEAQPDPSSLVAWVVRDHDSGDGPPAWREALAQILPAHLQPQRWVELPALPLTPHGKVDRAALLVPAAPASPANPPAPPETAAEAALLEVWRRVLGRPDAGCTDDFFALGGTSLRAIQVTAAWEQQTGHRLPPGMVLAHPTIRELLPAWERHRAGERVRSLVRLNGGTAGPPLIMIHGIGGDLFAHVELARELDPDLPLYGVQATENAGNPQRPATIAAAAAHYAQEIRAALPDGPYYLLGYSLGGVIAFEVAAQLHRAGARVARVFLIDSSPRNLPRLLHLWVQRTHLRRRLLHHLSRVRAVSWRRWPGFVRARWGGLNRQLHRHTHLLPPDFGAQNFNPTYADYYDVISWAHVPRPCPIPVTVFAAQDNDIALLPAWRYLTAGAGVEVVPVAAPHLAMLSTREHRRPIVALIRARLPTPSRSNA